MYHHNASLYHQCICRGAILVEMYHHFLQPTMNVWHGVLISAWTNIAVETLEIQKKSIIQRMLLPSSLGLSLVAKLSSLFVQQGVQRNAQEQQLSSRDGTPSSRRKQRLPMNDGLLSGCERLRLSVRDEQPVVMPSISGW